MISIVDHIEYLLRAHDCVILPGWGAFIAQHSSACNDGQNFMPPKRRYSFNGALTFSDGIIENSIMRSRKCSYNSASEDIKNVVTSLKHQIDLSGEVAMGRIGLFHKNNDGELMFTPFEQQSAACEFYGLAPFKMRTLEELAYENKPLVEESANGIDVSAPEYYDNENDDNIAWFHRINKDFMRIAASIIVLIVLTFVLTTPISVNSPVDFAGMNDSFKLKANNAISLTSDSVSSQKPLPADSNTLEMPQHTAIANDEIAEPISSRFKEGRLYLIVASGSSMKEAEKFVNQHKGTELRIYRFNDRYRVYAASGKNYDEMIAYQKDLQPEFKESWICRR